MMWQKFAIGLMTALLAASNSHAAQNDNDMHEFYRVQSSVVRLVGSGDVYKNNSYLDKIQQACPCLLSIDGDDCR